MFLYPSSIDLIFWEGIIIKHTFLLTEGEWAAAGFYYDHENHKVPVEGQTSITHHESVWIIEGYLKLMIENGDIFTNSYEINPIPEGKDYTCWKSYNPSLGKISGFFTIIADTIISQYFSACGSIQGCEVVLRINDQEYISRGTVFASNKKLSSWSVNLTRKNS